MSLAHQGTGHGAANDFAYCRPHKLERLPATARGQHVAAPPVGVMIVWVPATRPHLFEQFRRNTVALNRQRVIGIVLVDVVNKG